MSQCKLCNMHEAQTTDELEAWLLKEIEREHPDWVRSNGACPECVEYYRELGTVAVEPVRYAAL